MLSRRVRLLATVGVVCVVGGIGAGAGVLIYQSRATQTSKTDEQEIGKEELGALFPNAVSFAHYPFLNYVQPKQLELAKIANLQAYANDKTKAFGDDVVKIGDLVFANALNNATYWGERSKFLVNPAAYQKKAVVRRISGSELVMAVGVADALGKTWYDIGKVVL